MKPFKIYREQLWQLYREFALWKPNPVRVMGIYNPISIGDVGYMDEGAFIRMFNVTLSWDHESNKALGEPCPYDHLPGDFATRDETFDKVDHYSRRVLREEDTDNRHAWSPDHVKGVTYKCQGRGALLSLPHGGRRQDVIHTKLFEKYIEDNVVSWFKWSKERKLPVKRIEDLVLVYGCTMVTSWAAAAFDDNAAGAQVSLSSITLGNGGAKFEWSRKRGTVHIHNSQLDPCHSNSSVPQNQCVFIKCFRAKRFVYFIGRLRAAAEPLPDDPDNSQDDETQLIEGADTSKYRDRIAVLDCVVENCLEDDIDTDKDEMVTTRNDDLRFIENDSEVQTTDGVERLLNENDVPLLVADGALMPRHPLWQADVHEESNESSRTSYGATTVNHKSEAFGSLSRPPAQMQMPFVLARTPIGHQGAYLWR